MSIGAIRAIVRIQCPPEFDPRLGKVRPGATFGFDTSEKGLGAPVDDLLAVHVSKSIEKACGEFTLLFAPREPVAGYTWADLIPGYSLVEIWLQRYPDNPEPVLVMLGLTGTRLETEFYAQQEVERTVQGCGRELSCIFVDQESLYLPNLPQPVFPEDTSRATDLPAIFSPAAQLLGMAVIDPKLVHEGASPVEAIKHFIDMVRVGVKTDFNPDALPLLNLEFPDAKLADLLFFDEERAARELFDPSAQLPAAATLCQDQVALWNIMSAYSDPNYQELYTLTRNPEPGLSPRTRGFVEIRFRKYPFAGRIDAGGKLVDIAAPKGTQFDQGFAETETITSSMRDVVSSSLTRSVDHIQNLFYVYPRNPFTNDESAYKSIYQPILDAGQGSPSSFRRFGPRLRKVSDYYFRSQGSASSAQIGTARAKLLWAWHRYEPLFRRGSISTKGMPAAQVGKRLLIPDRRNGPMEFYINSWSHSLQLEQQEVSLATTLGVERGWPL